MVMGILIRPAMALFACGAANVGPWPDVARVTSSAVDRRARIRRGRLYDRRGGGENLLPVARARRVDALAVDRFLGALGNRPLRDHRAVPSLGVDGAPRAE